MNKKLVIFIGEGGSEASFIQEFLKLKYNFNDSLSKGAIVFENSKHYVLLSHPVLKNGNYGNKDAGDKYLLDPKTYIKIKGLVGQSFPPQELKDMDIIYLILTDINRKEEKKQKISCNLNEICMRGEIFYCFASKTIESWFLAGLGDGFKEKFEIDKNKFIKIYKKDTDTLQNIKDILDEILLPSGITGLRNQIGREFGKYIDIEQAKSKSPSFKIFIDTLDEIFGK